jgi:hypothetical protein
MSQLYGTFGTFGTKQQGVAIELHGGWMDICDDFWQEYMKWAMAFYHVRPESDIYDVFEWLRLRQPGSNPYSDRFVEKIDKEIERELGPWTSEN